MGLVVKSEYSKEVNLGHACKLGRWRGDLVLLLMLMVGYHAG